MLIDISKKGNNQLHADKEIPPKIRDYVADIFTWADLGTPLIQRDDPALELVNQLRSGRDEEGRPLTYGNAALYTDLVIDVLDDYFYYRNWSKEFSARQRPARRAVTVVIEELPRPGVPE